MRLRHVDSAAPEQLVGIPITVAVINHITIGSRVTAEIADYTSAPARPRRNQVPTIELVPPIIGRRRRRTYWFVGQTVSMTIAYYKAMTCLICCNGTSASSPECSPEQTYHNCRPSSYSRKEQYGISHSANDDDASSNASRYYRGKGAAAKFPKSRGVHIVDGTGLCIPK
jgi:hypothetical protein